MRRISLYIGIVFLTFVCGVVANTLVLKCFRSNIVTVDSIDLWPDTSPRFVAVSSLLEPDYHIYWYKTPTSDDPEEITLYADFRSPQVTLEHFESNSTSHSAKLIEIGPRLDENGHKIGKRGVSIFKDVQAVRIFWTDGDTFWFVQAPSLELAREFEQSVVVHSITMSNKRIQRTRLRVS